MVPATVGSGSLGSQAPILRVQWHVSAQARRPSTQTAWTLALALHMDVSQLSIRDMKICMFGNVFGNKTSGHCSGAPKAKAPKAAHVVLGTMPFQITINVGLTLIIASIGPPRKIEIRRVPRY